MASVSKRWWCSSPPPASVILSNLALLAVGLLASCSAKEHVGRPRGSPTPLMATSAAPQWHLADLDGDVFYEIFVRSFADSDGDGVGDFQGLISRLDYLNDGDPGTTHDLGVDGVWLMPVFESPSYHGYDVTNYERINPDYGTDADFDLFVAEAHRRGIRVVVDLMINHTSNQHPWFVESASSPSSPRRTWYVWRSDDPGWTQPWGGSYPTWHLDSDSWYYYGIFSGRMPDLDFRNPEVRAEVRRVAAYWLGRGVDGFRLDAARHIVANGPGDLQNDTPGTHDFWRDFSAFVRAKSPGTLLVGEVWSDTPTIASYYGSTDVVSGGDELPMNFNFPLAASIIQAVRSEDVAAIEATLTAAALHYPTGVLDGTFLANHDMVRVATQLNGDPARARMAAAILLSLPGTPFIYYGEEIGLANGPAAGDRSKRTPMPWNATFGSGFTKGKPWFPFSPGKDSVNVACQTGDPGSLLSHYRWLIQTRKASSALRTGRLELLTLTEESPSVLAFVRDAGDKKVLVLHNVGTAPVDAGIFALPTQRFERLYADEGVEDPGGETGAWRVCLPSHSTGIWAMR